MHIFLLWVFNWGRLSSQTILCCLMKGKKVLLFWVLSAARLEHALECYFGKLCFPIFKSEAIEYLMNFGKLSSNPWSKILAKAGETRSIMENFINSKIQNLNYYNCRFCEFICAIIEFPDAFSFTNFIIQMKMIIFEYKNKNNQLKFHWTFKFQLQ